MSQINIVVGQRIRAARLARGLSQEKLSELAKCHPTYIGQLERAEKNATIETIERIALALDVSLSSLFEHLGGSDSLEDEYSFLCYELISRKSKKQQQQYYQILRKIEMLE